MCLCEHEFKPQIFHLASFDLQELHNSYKAQFLYGDNTFYSSWNVSCLINIALLLWVFHEIIYPDLFWNHVPLSHIMPPPPFFCPSRSLCPASLSTEHQRILSDLSGALSIVWLLSTGNPCEGTNHNLGGGATQCCNADYPSTFLSEERRRSGTSFFNNSFLKNINSCFKVKENRHDSLCICVNFVWSDGYRKKYL